MRIVEPKEVHIVFLAERLSEFTADFLSTTTELYLAKVLTAEEEKELRKIYNDLEKVDADMDSFKKKFRERVKKMGMFDKYKAGNDGLDKIHLHSNADKLFRHLLQSLAKDYGKNIPKTITIKEVSERILIGTGGISNHSSHGYAMIALFGGQKGRDYFLFENPKMTRDIFTEQANNTLRNNNFWKRHRNERVTINPKYILQMWQE